MPKVHNSTNLVRYDLYLSIVADARLIEHLEPFKASRRVSDEMRRMLYATLDGTTPRTAQPAMVRQPIPNYSAYTDAMPTTQPDNIRTKLKKMFDVPE